MKTIDWSNVLSVQIEEIDEDHQRLIDLYNLLVDAVSAGSARNIIEAFLEELLACTAWHFKHEERLMLQYQYPGYDKHRAEHEGLLQSARTFQKKLQDEDRTLESKDFKFLENWLVGHILCTDMELGSFLCTAM